VAPSWLPQQAGDQVITARRDAVHRARLMRSGDLTPVSVPQVADAALRALSRARADAIPDLKAAPCRLNASLLRYDIRDTGRAAWGPAHRRWRSAGGWATPAPHLVFHASVRAVHEPPERLPRRDHARHEPVPTGRLQPVIEARQALRGGPFTVAVTRVAALGELTRMDTPRQLRRDLGLPPSADASGERRRPGAITTTGHPHARRALIAGAWAYRSPAQVSRHLQRRLETRPTPLQDRRWKAPARRCHRDRRLRARGQQANQLVVARARDVIACLWAIAQEVPRPRETQTVARSALVLTHV
jgi:transposase